MKTISIFASSSGHMAYTMKDHIPVEGSYIHYLHNDPTVDKVDGFWLNGLTILHVRNIIRQKVMGVVRPDLNWLILNVGVVEAFTHKASNFLECVIQYLFQWGEDPWFRSYVLPKAIKASNDITKGVTDTYYSFLSPQQFESLYDEVLTVNQGQSTIIIGFSCPDIPDDDPHMSQAIEYDAILRRLAIKYNVHYLDVWALCFGEVIDTTHFSEAGHSIIFNAIKDIIQ